MADAVVSPFSPIQQSGVRALNPPDLIVALREPTDKDFQWFVGTIWIYLNNDAYILIGKPINVANWQVFGASSTLTTLTGDSGGAISPSAGNINVLGTVDQITTTGSGSTITWSLPSTLIAPGSLEVTTTFTADGASTLAALTQVGTASINGSGSATTTIGSSAAGNIAIGSGGTIISTSVGATTINSGTGALSISNDASATTVTVAAGAAVKTLTLGSTNSTSATTLQSGSGALHVTSTNGAMTLASGTGEIDISADATNTTVKLATGAGAKLLTLGSTNGASSVTVNVGTGNFSLVGGGNTVGIANDAAANLVTLGSTTGAAALTLQSGTGNFSITGATTTTFSLGLATGTGAISLGISTAAETLNILSASTITGAQVVNILNGATPGANTTLNIMDGAGTAGTQTVNMLASGATRAGAINIGTGAAAHVLTIGSTTGAAALTLQAGSAGITMTGAIANSSTITSAGNILINGAGKFLGIHHGAVTDFCGTGTLSSGTVTIANTNINTGDIIILTRTAANGSTTFGELSYTISNTTSFTVTSLILGTPGSTQTADSSTFAYVIIRPI